MSRNERNMVARGRKGGMQSQKEAESSLESQKTTKGTWRGRLVYCHDQALINKKQPHSNKEFALTGYKHCNAINPAA